MMSVVISFIIVLGIGGVLVDSYRGYNRVYDRAFSDVVVQGHTARRKFDKIIRQSSINYITCSPDGLQAEVYYYAIPSPLVTGYSTELDRYGRFYLDNDKLMFESAVLNESSGTYSPGTVISTETLCDNVVECSFVPVGASIRMAIKLDNNKETLEVITCAVAHNEIKVPDETL